MNNNMFGTRQCQKNTFNSCRNNNFGIVSDTCGSGKSRVQDALICQSIEDAMNNNEYSICVFQAPRLCLIEQQEDNFYNFQQNYYPNIDFSAFEISSANRSECKEHDKIDSSTRVDEIAELIMNHINNKKSLVIFLCNASIEKLYKTINTVLINYPDFKIDEYIVDEGHYNTNNMAKNIV